MSEGRPDHILREEDARAYRARWDPVVGLLMVLALNLGTLSIAPDARYALLWTALGALALLIALPGLGERFGAPRPEAFAGGVGVGALVAGPLALVTAQLLGGASDRIFAGYSDALVLQTAIFAMPAAETLFFRGVLQESGGLLQAGVLASIWSWLMFLPAADVSAYPAVGVLLALILAAFSFIYAYVRQRSGLAAAWTCQITSGALLFFLPRIIG